jgi:enoyl-CoA hydratase
MNGREGKIMNFKHTLMKVKENTAILIMDSPPVNALGAELKRELAERLDDIEQNEDIWTVILTAAGKKIFAAGAAIPSLLDLDYEAGLARVRETRMLYSNLENLQRPTIAAINGSCLGGGLELALCCDFRITADHVKLGFPEVHLGIMPGAGGTQRLPRIINPGLAKYLVFTGATLNAAEALSCGLVTKVTPYEALMEKAENIASEINKGGPLAVRSAKRAVNESTSLPLEEGLNLENKLWARLCYTRDKREGIRAFLEKRIPEFKAR